MTNLMKWQIQLQKSRPTRYGSLFKRKFIEDRKVVGMKTHNWHNLLQDFLPMVVHGTLRADVCKTVYRLRQFFILVCAKKIKISDLPELQEQGAKLACHLEIVFLPSVFDIEVHLIVHIVDDIVYTGSVHYRWVYFVERFLKQLKDM